MTNLEYLLEYRCRDFLVRTLVDKVAEVKVCIYENLPYDYSMFLDCVSLVALWLDEEYVEGTI